MEFLPPCPKSTGEVIIEAMQAAKAAGVIISFDLNFRAKLWNIWGGPEQAQKVIRRIVKMWMFWLVMKKTYN